MRATGYLDQPQNSQRCNGDSGNNFWDERRLFRPQPVISSDGGSRMKISYRPHWSARQNVTSTERFMMPIRRRVTVLERRLSSQVPGICIMDRNSEKPILIRGNLGMRYPSIEGCFLASPSGVAPNADCQACSASIFSSSREQNPALENRDRSPMPAQWEKSLRSMI